MSTIQDIFACTRDRPLALRRRPDLVIAEHVYRGERFWMIKDPLELEFYRLNVEEHAVLMMIDGRRSIDDIKAEFEAAFPPQRITHRELQSFISDLHEKSLLAYETSDVGARLIERAREKQWKKVKQNLSGIFSLKWRGVDPDRFLDWLTPKIGWMFSLPAVVVSLLFMASAGLWLLVHYDTFMARLPALDDFLQPRNWLLLAGVIMVMKIIHELGHGVSFKRYGGECHEIGVMLLLFIPTLYCNTGDSWLLRDKWRRAAIGAAGMYVELLIAAAATFGWWFTQPGTFNMICLNIMATGSISVLLFNGNPLLKFDGYFILADVLELPNLVERSGLMTQFWFLKYCLGINEDAEKNSPFATKLTLVLFKVASFAFRVFVVGTVLFLLIDRMNPVGLGYFGLVLGMISVGALFVPPLWSLYKFFKVPGRLHRIEMNRFIPTVIGAGLVLSFVCGMPLPHYVTCQFTILPRDARSVYVKHEAILKAVHVRPGQEVTAGTLIAEVENLGSLLKLTSLKADGDEIAAELRVLERGRGSSPGTVARINQLRESLATNAEKAREYEDIVSSFRITAPRSGQVIPEWTNRRPDSGERLGSWDGCPLGDENLGTWLSSGQRLCIIGDLQELDAVLVVNEYDISLLREGQATTLLLDSAASRRFSGRIESIARNQSEDLPESLAEPYGGTIQLQVPNSETDAARRPSDEHFEARVSLPASSVQNSSGLRGHALVRVGSRTIFQRVTLFLYRNFRKKL